MQSPKWYKNPLFYLAIAGVIALSIPAVRALTHRDVNSYPTPTTNTTTPATTYPTVTVTPEPTQTPIVTTTPLNRYLESPDKLASVECFAEAGCAPEELQKYMDAVYPLSAGGKRVNAVVSDRYKWVDNQLVKQNEKVFQLAAENDYDPADGGVVRVEWEYENGDASKMDWLTRKSGDVYNFVADTMPSSRKPDIYVTVSKDGARSNITVLSRSPTNELRKSMTTSYSWHFEEDMSQMAYEMGVTFNRALGYTKEDNANAFLSEFWGVRAMTRNAPNMGLGKTLDEEKALIERTRFSYSSNGDSFQQTKLGADIYRALAVGIGDSGLIQLAQKLEGKRATWEQFKSEADAVAGRHLEFLDYIDSGVKLFRESQK